VYVCTCTCVRVRVYVLAVDSRQDDTVRVEETRPYRGCHGGSQMPEAIDNRQEAIGQMPEARHDEVRVEETRPYRGGMPMTGTIAMDACSHQSPAVCQGRAPLQWTRVHTSRQRYAKDGHHCNGRVFTPVASGMPRTGTTAMDACSHQSPAVCQGRAPLQWTRVHTSRFDQGGLDQVGLDHGP
jgi:hypothetical protein